MRVIVSLLPSTSKVREAYLGSQGVIKAKGGVKPSLFIDCSTISPAACREIGMEIGKSNLHHNARPFSDCSAAHPAMLDAPISGGELTAATAATLTFTVHLWTLKNVD